MGAPPDSSKGCHERSGVLEGTLPLSLCMDLQTLATSVMEPDVAASASLSCSEQIRAAWSIHVIMALQIHTMVLLIWQCGEVAAPPHLLTLD